MVWLGAASNVPHKLMARSQDTACTFYRSSPHRWSVATGSRRGSLSSGWLLIKGAHRQVHTQHRTTVKFWLGGAHAACPQAHGELYFLNRVKMCFLLWLASSASMFLWQMAHHSKRHSQAAGTNHKQINLYYCRACYSSVRLRFDWQSRHKLALY